MLRVDKRSIRSLMAAEGIKNYRQLAQASSLSERGIYKALAGNPTLATVASLALALGAHPFQILTTDSNGNGADNGG